MASNRTFKVLIIGENMKTMLRLHRELQDPFDPYIANSPRAAMDLIRNSHPFDLVFFCWKDPKNIGIDFVGQVRELLPKAIRILYSVAATESFEMPAHSNDYTPLAFEDRRSSDSHAKPHDPATVH